MKTRMVSASITSQGLLRTRSVRSWRTLLRCSLIGSTRSRVVKKVIKKHSVPTAANSAMVLRKPCALSPFPRINTNGSSSTWMMNCAKVTARKRYADKLLRCSMLPVSTPLKAEYGRLLATYTSISKV